MLHVLCGGHTSYARKFGTYNRIIFWGVRVNDSSSIWVPTRCPHVTAQSGCGILTDPTLVKVFLFFFLNLQYYYL